MKDGSIYIAASLLGSVYASASKDEAQLRVRGYCA